MLGKMFFGIKLVVPNDKYFLEYISESVITKAKDMAIFKFLEI